MAWFGVVDRRGTTRTVWLVGRWAVKFPTLHSWELFLQGLLGNCREARWGGLRELWREPALPPVVFVCPGGWFQIQRRVRPVRHRGLFWVDLAEVVAKSELPEQLWTSDAKPENFGWLGSQLVKIDVGS